jgi:hypothetical protein
LPQTVINMDIDTSDCDFDCVFNAVSERAHDFDNCPELLSWFDKSDQTYFPKGECCVEGEPSWLAFGEGQKSDLTIDVNNEEYVFLFRKSHGLP